MSSTLECGLTKFRKKELCALKNESFIACFSVIWILHKVPTNSYATWRAKQAVLVAVKKYAKT